MLPLILTPSPRLPTPFIVRVQAAGSRGTAPLPEDWTAFKRRYLAPDGRVVDTGNAGISHSEGQSYGMLFAVFFDDRAAFDQMWGWIGRTLRRATDSLFAWKYVPRGTPTVPDQNNATDGDLLIAWALLRAAHKWGEASYAEAATRIARDVLRACTTDFVGRRILLPGVRGFQRGNTIVVNPSYFAIGAFRALSRHVPDASWAALEAASLDILRASALGRWRLPPDWCEISRDATIRPAPDWPPRFSWDAVRIPVHLAWAGLPEPSVEAAARFFFDQSHPYRPPAWTDLYRDQISPYPGHAGILAVAQFAAMRTGVTAPMRRIAISESPDYYGASLVLMTGMASVEPPEAPAEVPPAAAPAPAGGGRMAAVMRYLGLRDDTTPVAPVSPSQRESPLARRGGRDPGGR
jgi:endo-1,4-beta-D-glucanase Y